MVAFPHAVYKMPTREAFADTAGNSSSGDRETCQAIPGQFPLGFYFGACLKNLLGHWRSFSSFDHYFILRLYCLKAYGTLSRMGYVSFRLALERMSGL